MIAGKYGIEFYFTGKQLFFYNAQDYPSPCNGKQELYGDKAGEHPVVVMDGMVIIVQYDNKENNRAAG